MNISNINNLNNDLSNKNFIIFSFKKPKWDFLIIILIIIFIKLL
jgi:hypothetical protein